MQAGHAALEYAYQHGRPKDYHPTFIKLVTQNKNELEHLKSKLNDHGIITSEFHEPYQNWGLTAISCLLTEEQRHHLSHLPLWKTY